MLEVDNVFTKAKDLFSFKDWPLFINDRWCGIMVLPWIYSKDRCHLLLLYTWTYIWLWENIHMYCIRVCFLILMTLDVLSLKYEFHNQYEFGSFSHHFLFKFRRNFILIIISPEMIFFFLKSGYLVQCVAFKYDTYSLEPCWT